MRVHGSSFFLGMAVAGALPLLTRVFRPLAVQLTSAGLELVDEARRVATEQAETMSDILAEARARRAMPEPASSEDGAGETRRRAAGRATRRRGERRAGAERPGAARDETVAEKRPA